MSKQYDLRSVRVALGDFIADSDAIKAIIWRVTEAVKISAVYLGFDSAITAQDTDYNTIAVTDGTNTIASTATGPAATGNSFAAGVPESLTVVAAYAEQAAGAVILLEHTKTGNGLLESGAWVQIDYYPYNV